MSHHLREALDIANWTALVIYACSPLCTRPGLKSYIADRY